MSAMTFGVVPNSINIAGEDHDASCYKDRTDSFVYCFYVNYYGFETCVGGLKWYLAKVETIVLSCFMNGTYMLLSLYVP